MISLVIKYFPRVVTAFILLQTLFFKFGIGGEEFLKESQDLFSKVAEGVTGSAEAEAFFRIGTGIIELIASILILIPKSSLYGSILVIGLMLGALLSHLLFIGISVNGDGGTLMIMAFIVLFCGCWVLWQEKEKLSQLLK